MAEEQSDDDAVQVAEALGDYSDLLADFGPDSAEAERFRAEHSHLPEFATLADECRQLERTFRGHRPAPSSGATRQFLDRRRHATGQMVAVGLVGVNWIYSMWATPDHISRIDWWDTFLSNFVINSSVILVASAIVIMLLWQLSVKWRTPMIATVACFLGLSIPVVAVANSKASNLRADLNSLLVDLNWIAFDPPTMDPIARNWPTVDELKDDLKKLREEAGFDGVITFGSDNSLAEIPRIAREEAGFRGVIMGVYVSTENPQKPVEQLRTAIAARPWVDGYCVGHLSAGRIDFDELASWVSELRDATGLPVTTSFPINCYDGLRGERLRQIGDWYFPDIHGSWHFAATPQEVLDETKRSLRIVSNLPVDKPVLLKMISYPSAGAGNVSEQAQYEFYAGFFRDFSLPPGVYPSFFAAYDRPWAAKVPNWPDTERHVGLFTTDGTPKKAVQAVRAYQQTLHEQVSE